MTRKTVTESDILHVLKTAPKIAKEESDDAEDDDPVEHLLTPVEALTSVRKLD